jgi:hypothetical protein
MDPLKTNDPVWVNTAEALIVIDPPCEFFTASARNFVRGVMILNPSALMRDIPALCNIAGRLSFNPLAEPEPASEKDGVDV